MGCASLPTADLKAALAAAKPCCQGFETVGYAALAPMIRREFELTTSSPAMPSPEGMAYFAGFRLPPGAAEIEVQSMYGFYLPTATYPDPLVLVLDAQFREIARATNFLLGNRDGGFWLGPYLGANMILPPNSHYIVVFARPNSERGAGVRSDNGTYWRLPASSIGAMAIVVVR